MSLVAVPNGILVSLIQWFGISSPTGNYVGTWLYNNK